MALRSSYAVRRRDGGLLGAGPHAGIVVLLLLSGLEVAIWPWR